MPVIDVDGHVEESPATFSDDFLDPAYRDRRPIVVAGGNRAFWMVDDRLIPKLVGRAPNVMGTPTGHGTVLREISAKKPESIESLELKGTAARLADIRREDIDLQVIYPTLFLAGSLSADPKLSQALCRSYNRWIASVCAEDLEHFRWVAVIDLEDVPSALEALREAHELPGMVGVMLLGTVGDRMLDARPFEPFWATAAEMDLPVAIHVGWPCPSLNNLYDNLFNSQVGPFVITVFMALVNVVSSGLLDRYPALRLAFLEAGSEWLPYWLGRMQHYYEVAERVPQIDYRAKEAPYTYLRRGNLYVSCEVEEPMLPEVLAQLGDDCVLYASDIPHADRERFSVRTLHARKDIPDASKEKILWGNGRRFYGLA
jgi:predicted TIM-barrel fold metal-dependent hydrolase